MQRYKKFITYQIRPSDRNLKRLSHVGFLVAIGLTAWLHDLRSTFGESAMILYNLINHPDFSMISEWGNLNFFQNIVTILAVKTKLSLTWISLIFSVSPMILAYGIFWITEYGFKQKYSGIFLLMLLLGINTSFFGAVNSAYSGLCLAYLLVSFMLFIFKKYFIKKGIQLSVDWEFRAFGLLAFGLLICLRRPPLFYFDAKWGDFCFLPLRYLSGMALNTYVIVGLLGAYLIVFLLARKNFEILKLIFMVSMIFLILTIFFNKKLQFSFDYEILFLPLMALVLIAVKGFVLEPFPMTKLRFQTLCILVFLAIGGQLRTLQTFQKRQVDVIRLLQSTNAMPVEKIALSENLQQVEKYIDPTYLAFETPIISALHNMPQKSIFFIPKGTTYPNTDGFWISDTVQNRRYFRLSDQIYRVLEKPLMPRKLVADILCDSDSAGPYGTYKYDKIPNMPRVIFENVYTQTQNVFSGTRSVFTGKENQYAMDLYLGKLLKRGDSVEISVWRKGSDEGHLVVSDCKNPSKIWNLEQTVSEPDERGWQKLSYIFILNQNEHPLKTYVWNSNYKNEDLFFDDFRVKIWRE